MTGLVKAMIVLVALISGFATKLFFGDTVSETSQDVISNVVESVTSVDLTEIFDLDNK